MGSDLVVAAHWDKDDSYWVRPDQIPVTLYGIPGGTGIASWVLPPVEHSGKPAENIAGYSLTVPDRDLPAGTFLLVAVDPLSGATARTPVVLHGSGMRRAQGVAASSPGTALHLPQLDLPILRAKP
jgi:hypothetical protein